VLTAADDDFHPATGAEPSWTETCWFAAAIPERGMVVWTYPLFRPELSIMSCGVYLWAPRAEELWELPYYRTWWHLPIPDGIEPTSFELPIGLSYERLEPLSSYRISYADGDALAVDFTFNALHPPHPFGVKDGCGHLDQLGRIRGELTLHGERLEINCVEMRDRTWGPRRESRQGTRLGYSYGTTSPEAGFHCSTLFDPRSGESRLMTGYALRDGATVPLRSAVREVVRDARGRPARIEVRAEDEDGRPLEAAGEVISRLAMPSTPYFVWASLVCWRFADGSEGFGEDQDTWSPGLLREFLRGRAGERAARPQAS